MEMFGVVYIGLKIIIYNICKCVEKVGLGINELVIILFVLIEIILIDGEKDFGIIVIDMGGG